MIEKIQSNHLATRRLAELLRVWYHSKSDTEQRWYPIGVGKKDNHVFFLFLFLPLYSLHLCHYGYILRPSLGELGPVDRTRLTERFE